MKRLLLVDDDALVLRAYRERLSAHGFQVNTAADASAAMTILRSAKPDLVVVDLMMPPLSGVEVLKFIRTQPRLASIPVVVLTNAFLNDLGRQAAAIGIERALLKAQCSPSVLMGVIDEILEPKKAPLDSSPLPAASNTSPGVVPGQPAPGLQLTQSDIPPATQPSHVQASPSIPAAQAQTRTVNRSTEGPPGAGASFDLLAKALASCAELRKLLQPLSRAPQAGPEQAQQLQDLYRRVHFLTAVAGLTRYTQIAQVASVFEALLYVLIEKPTLLGPSVQRTLANLVDFVELLFQRARESPLDVPCSARVLAVDDDPLSNELVVRALREHEIQARRTEDPLVAWQWLQQEHYDLVLLDIEMPGLTGFELCKRLRTVPAYKKTPVIFVTSHSDFANRAQSTLSGGDDLLAKPVLPMELTAKVLMHLLKSGMAA